MKNLGSLYNHIQAVFMRVQRFFIQIEMMLVGVGGVQSIERRILLYAQAM
jgi:hypothetical protein